MKFITSLLNNRGIAEVEIWKISGIRHFLSLIKLLQVLLKGHLDLSGIIHSAEHEEIVGLFFPVLAHLK